MISGYQRAYNWIQNNIDPNDFNNMDEFLQEIRDQFQNDNLIDSIEEEIIQSNLDNYIQD